MSLTGPASEVPAADRLDMPGGTTVSAETCELLNAITGSASAFLLAPPDWSVLCSAPPAASVPRSLHEKLCPPPVGKPVLLDLREADPALRTGSVVPAGLVALAVVPLTDENVLWGVAVLCWATEPSRLITPRWLASLGRMVSAARARARLAGALQRAEARWAAVYEMSAALSHALDSGILLDEVVRRSVEILGGLGGVLGLVDEQSGDLVVTVVYQREGGSSNALGRRLGAGQGVMGAVLASRQPVIVENYTEWTGRLTDLASNAVTIAAVPLLAHEHLLGVLAVNDRAGRRRFTEDDVQALTLFAQQAAAVLKERQNRRQAETLALQAERTRLASDLHDGVAQDLAALLLRADACQALLGEGSGALRGQLETISVGLQRAIRDTRATICALRSSDLTGCSLQDALAAQVARFQTQAGLPVHFSMVGADCQRLDHERELALLHVTQEALTNVRKHAGAERVSVQLTWVGTDKVQLRIEDNGNGFDPGMIARAGGVGGEHAGLGLMRERVEALGGTFSVESEASQGTTVCAVLPVWGGECRLWAGSTS